ncbi:transcription factor HHO6-like [Henckelia pumila]|uniref:transcription factor HHO6-like n=1 Tax=Henckelia pumila TaxID=405737 RepID=UPI003C6E6C4B
MGVGSRICPELSLDCPSSSRCFVQKPIGMFLDEVSTICSVPEKISKLDEYVCRLQDEVKKIYGFKRELPFCMLLLNDAIVMMKDELMKCRRSSTQPLLKEFIPLKKNEEVEIVKENTLTNVITDERSWKNSLQLGNLNNNHHFGNSGFDDINHMLKQDISRKSAKEEKNHPLEIMVKEEDDESSLESNLKAGEKQPTKKQRRSWSPELHHRFVEALLKLGGPGAATPRLIRENMAVDGLTLDQVKSHLQKYRIHMKKSNPSANIQPHVVGIGAGLRPPQEPRGESLKLSSSQSGSPHGPSLLTGSSHGTSTTTGGDTIVQEDDDERSVIHSWRSQLQRCVV